MGIAFSQLFSSLFGSKEARILQLDLMSKQFNITTSNFKSGISVVRQVSVDSSDTDRLVVAKEEFHAILEEEELKGAVVLIYANKQDLPGALDDAAVTESLELHKIKSRQWSIFKTSATKGEGIFEGLDWLSNTLKSGV
ncbi:hypothetical protein Leryth_009455 [Lithospermum erythrorhizon]|nr:hypothetical protein Leryth_009455 [Lithospermum erythrorhizon]